LALRSAARNDILSGSSGGDMGGWGQGPTTVPPLQ
jgi:hypothetical protein